MFRQGRRQRVSWAVLGGVVLAVVILGVWGFSLYQQSDGRTSSLMTVGYLTLQLFTLESGALFGDVPWQLEVARLAAPVVAAYAVVRLAAEIFAAELDRLRVRRLRNHTVVIGLDECGRALCQELVTRGHRVLAVDPHGGHSAAALRNSGVLVFPGDPTSVEGLKACRIDRAEHLVVRGADDDATARIVTLATEVVRQEPVRRGDHRTGTESLTCVGVLSDPDLWLLLTMREMRRGTADRVRVDFVDLDGAALLILLRQHPPVLTRQQPGTEPPDVLITGNGEIAERALVALLLGASAAVHLLGADADWLGRVRRDHTWVSSDTVTVVHDIEREIRPMASPVRAYVCDEDVHEALHRTVQLRSTLSTEAEIVVVRRSNGDVTRLLEQEAGPDGCSVATFSLAGATCTPDVLLHGTSEILGRALHDQYVQKRSGDGAAQGDLALAPWDQLPESLRESNRDQARHISTKMWAVGRVLGPLRDPDCGRLAPHEVEFLAGLEHERWVTERRRNGWRPGPRDPSAKTTPYLVPWDELSEDVRDLDRVFMQELPDTLASVGLQAIKARTL